MPIVSGSSQNLELRITGVGYLDHINELTSKAGEPFLACDIIALTGRGADATRRIEVTVSGSQAEAVVRRCRREVNEGKAVMVAFHLSDVWAKVVNYTRGPKGGTVEACLKSRLVAVSRIGPGMTPVYGPLHGGVTD